MRTLNMLLPAIYHFQLSLAAYLRDLVVILTRDAVGALILVALLHYALAVARIEEVGVRFELVLLQMLVG